MKLPIIDIRQEAEGWHVVMTNGNGLKVHIEGCETKAIAIQQARDRKKELKKAGLWKAE